MPVSITPRYEEEPAEAERRKQKKVQVQKPVRKFEDSDFAYVDQELPSELFKAFKTTFVGKRVSEQSISNKRLREPGFEADYTNKNMMQTRSLLGPGRVYRHYNGVKYEQTVKDVKAAVAKKTGVPADKQQLFWRQKELTPAYDNKTLLDMHLHTGFSLRGYDLTEEPVYWPPVRHSQEGLVVDEDACAALCNH